MAGERLVTVTEENKYKLRLIGTRMRDGRQYNLPIASEVEALIVGYIDSNINNMDIILHMQEGGLKRISELHPSYVALQYLLLFLYVEDGYWTDIYHEGVTEETPTNKKTRVTMREYFAYRLQNRSTDFSMVLNARRLCQQFIVDAYTMIERERMSYIKNQQKDLRSETYSKLEKLTEEEVAAFKLRGKKVILPSSYTAVHTVEFQKRGLPHAHILLFLEQQDKMTTPAHIDKYISAEIPDKNEDPELYEIVTDHMMHAPCGADRPSCPCMVKNKVTAAVEDVEVDEIKEYYDCRYLSACEAAWRIYGFDIHYRFPPVERLPFHLKGEQSVIFDATDSIDYALDKASVNETKFIAWMETNKTDEEARKLLYHEFPTYYVKGATDWVEFKTFEKIVYPTYKDACQARGLLEDDKEYIDGLLEASLWGSGNYLRTFFVMLIMTDSMSRPEIVYEKTWEVLAADVLHVERAKRENPCLELTDNERKNICLTYIEHMLLCNNKSLKHIPNMPYPNEMFNMASYNRLVYDELKYDKQKLTKEHKRLYTTLTNEQKGIYRTLIEAVNGDKGGMFFVYGYGGTGKTYLYKTLSAALRSKGEIVLNVASSGIATLLLEGGRTAHSRFAIPINVVDDSMCHISADSELAELIRMAKLIIWDEAPMTHKHCYEAFDRTLKDICRTDPTTPNDNVFGGKVVLFGGDFRQILPVVTNGSKQDVVHASINSSYLWKHCNVMRLTENMRLGKSANYSEKKEIQDFAYWILSIGNGTIGGKNDGETTIEFPNDILMPDSSDHIGSLIEETYPQLIQNLYNPTFFQEKSILAPTHALVDMINDRMLELIPGDEKTYESSDSVGIVDMDTNFNESLYTGDFLNSIKVAGLPQHSLKLKIGAPVMCMKNIDQRARLCNGT
ncbi:DNA helicase PIF1, ATP-dependent [Tanacetum coccineum]|uniref:ATP-dependent DNA helicase n=1 Tax=Tanacetum coccineum TaxID=301880 RepID=A0ABQ5FXG0_9ASTR